MLRFVWWLWKWSFATVFFLAIMAGATYFVFNRAVEGGEYVVVPSIVGKPAAEAYAILLEEGLEIGETHEMRNENVPTHHVIAQRPVAGKVVRAGRKVFPTISTGPDLAAAPDLVGMTVEEARESLAELGPFQVRMPVASLPHTAAINTILGQDPPPGKRISADQEISLLVSAGTGTERVQAPDLGRMSLKEAQQALRTLGLVPEPVLLEDASAPADRVTRQSPAGGTLVEPGSEVRFWIRTSEPLEAQSREVHVEYEIPDLSGTHEVRFAVPTEDGGLFTLYPQPDKHYENGRPPTFRAGQRIRFPFTFKDEVMVHIFLDGRKVRTVEYEIDGKPRITNY